MYGVWRDILVTGTINHISKREIIWGASESPIPSLPRISQTSGSITVLAHLHDSALQLLEALVAPVLWFMSNGVWRDVLVTGTINHNFNYRGVSIIRNSPPPRALIGP